MGVIATTETLIAVMVILNLIGMTIAAYYVMKKK